MCGKMYQNYPKTHTKICLKMYIQSGVTAFPIPPVLCFAFEVSAHFFFREKYKVLLSAKQPYFIFQNLCVVFFLFCFAHFFLLSDISLTTPHIFSDVFFYISLLRPLSIKGTDKKKAEERKHFSLRYSNDIHTFLFVKDFFAHPTSLFFLRRNGPWGSSFKHFFFWGFFF